MLTELHVRNLGVVDDVSVVLQPGMTAVTGETGAGKTLLLEAIRLLVGGRAEAQVVRTGAQEAWVEGRFVDIGSNGNANRTGDDGDGDDAGGNVEGDDGAGVEQVMARAVSATGRSRAYVNGRMVTVNGLAEVGAELVDLHSQHAHHALLAPAVQRGALDAFAGIDTGPLREAIVRVKEIEAELAKFGGDTHARAREVDLLRFQLTELEEAAIDDPGEDGYLQAEEERLANVAAHREAAACVHEELGGDAGAGERLSLSLKAVAGREPLAAIERRLREVVAEVDDLVLEASHSMEQLQDDPERLESVQDRRALLHRLRRKYGATLAEVMAFRDGSREQLSQLEHHDQAVAELEAALSSARAALDHVRAKVGHARRGAAGLLAEAVEVRLHQLALPHARFAVQAGKDEQDLAADEVTFLLGPNPGEPLLPLAKAASGGELARSMLALRLALLSSGNERPETMSSGNERPANTSSGNAELQGPATLVFDEVDAGIGGQAAVEVGRALADLAHSVEGQQVLVVTHLPQVAAFADHQITVQKQQEDERTVARVQLLDDAAREVELARMLAGKPDSRSGRLHARELLQEAASRRLPAPGPGPAPAAVSALAAAPAKTKSRARETSDQGPRARETSDQRPILREKR